MQLYKDSKFNITCNIDDNGHALVYNSRTGKTLIFEKDTYASFHGKENLVKDEIWDELIKQGFVVPQELDEIGQIKYETRQSAYSTRPSSLQFVIAPTMGCNYRCVYCFEEGHECHDNMTSETIDSIYQFILQTHKRFPTAKRIGVSWFGGEPTLRLDVIRTLSKKLITYAEENKLQYNASMVSNGYLLTKEVAQELKELHVQRVQITLDGMKETYTKMKVCPEDGFDTVIKNIEDIGDILNVNIRLNTNKDNVAEMKELVQYLFEEKKLNAHVYLASITCYDDFSKGLDKNDFESSRKEVIDFMIEKGLHNYILMKTPERHWTACMAGQHNSFAIDPSGNIYRCEHNLGRSEYRIGNVATGLFYNDWNSKFLDNVLPDKCYECALLPQCQGGCINDRIVDNIEMNCDAKLQQVIIDVKTTIAIANINHPDDSFCG